MYKIVLKSVVAVSVIAVTGCASYGNWQPTVDPYGDPNAHRIGADLAECRQWALQASGGTPTQAVTGGLVGGALGAAAGAAIGAAAGNAGTGAAVGAATGGMGGGVYQGMGAEETYKSAYVRCMHNRGHRVLN